MKTNFSYTQVSDPSAAQVAAFKAFASISDGQDALYGSLLKTAMLRVGDWEDKVLLPASMALKVWDYGGGRVTLYRGADTVQSVKDTQGNDLPYEIEGRELTVKASVSAFEIRYSATAGAGDVERFQAKVWRYATALYDGEDAQTCQRILIAR